MDHYPKLSRYTSEIDQTLQKFDAEHPTPSISQQKEWEKHARVYYLRDTPDRPEQFEKIGEDF